MNSDDYAATMDQDIIKSWILNTDGTFTHKVENTTLTPTQWRTHLKRQAGENLALHRMVGMLTMQASILFEGAHLQVA